MKDYNSYAKLSIISKQRKGQKIKYAVTVNDPTPPRTGRGSPAIIVLMAKNDEEVRRYIKREYRGEISKNAKLYIDDGFGERLFRL